MRMNSLLVNAGMNGVSQGLGKLVRFVITSIALMQFGAASWGEVVFALTLVTYLNFVLDFGLSSLALIEHPDDEKLDRKLFVALGYTRGLVIFLMAVLGLVAFAFLDVPGGIVLKVYLLQLFLRPVNIDWWLSRKGYTGINPVVQLVRQILVLGFVWSMKFPSIEYFAVLDVGSEIVATAALWFIGPHRKFSVCFPTRAEWRDAWGCYRCSFILFVSSSLLMLHQNVDIFFLKFFSGNASVGVYDYCYRYALFVFVLGGALSIPLRRQLARLKESGAVEDGCNLVLSSHKFLGLMSAGFMFLTIALSDIFFLRIVPIGVDFPASRLLALFACWLIVAFYSVPWSEWLISQSRRDYLALAIVAGVVNVATNLVLVPEYGILGAAMAKICSETGIFLFLFCKVQAGMRKQFFRVIWIHVALIPCVVTYFKTGTTPWWLLSVTVIAEILLVLLLKYISKKDFQILARN